LTSKPAGLVRLGVYGGAFDPPHLAHHTLAATAIVQLGLDQLRIFPTGQAWHKSYQPTAAEHRVAMARLAFADLSQVLVDTRETQRPGATYTIDTLTELRAENPGAELFLLMGSDQFKAFDTWHRWHDIAKIATICIAARAISISAKDQKDAEKQEQTACKMVYIQMPPMTTSATDIRERVRQGLGIDHLVKADIARYIAQYHLYTAPI
jgi:nicotinate-nucleotide adenylyltransferase